MNLLLFVLSILSVAVGFDLGHLPPHPRLMLTNKRADDVVAMNKSDSYYQDVILTLRHTADTAIATPLSLATATNWSSNYRMQVGAVAGIFRLSKNTTYSKWVADGLLTLAKLPDWDPSNYLTTADIVMTSAIGYDWIYDALTADQRNKVEQAIIEKAFLPALNLSGAPWRNHTNNWAQVTGGCLVMAALAIGDTNQTLANEVMDFSIHQINVSLSQYAPDGGWIEGYSYGTYAGVFLSLMLRSLETALGNTLGLACLPGMKRLGDWLTHSYGQAGGFSFGDGAWTFANANSLWSAGYWAQKFKKPEWLQGMLSHFNVSQVAAFQAFIFYSSALRQPDVLPNMPRYDQFKGVAGMSYRSSWTSSDGWFFGFMGGFNGRSHGHLDAGSFVVDYKGTRWAELLGSDSYSLPSYFSGDRRWSYYRCRSEGANTLSISDKAQTPLHFANQIPSANNSLRWVGSFDAFSRFGIANLTEAYSSTTKSVFRGVALLNDSQLIVRDEVRASAPVDIATSWHTSATVQLQIGNKSATLTQADKVMVVKVLSPPDAYLQIADTNPCNAYSPCSESHNDGIYNLVVRLASLTTRADIIVTLQEQNVITSTFKLPLKQWYGSCKLDCWKSENIIEPYWLKDSEIYY